MTEIEKQIRYDLAYYKGQLKYYFRKRKIAMKKLQELKELEYIRDVHGTIKKR